MAHIELGYRAAAVRPAAPFNPARTRETAQTVRPARPRPKFCRINPGQLARTAFLVGLCIGVSQLPRVEKSPASGAVAALQVRA
ncbi:hypothetical protein [Methylocystis echinoides]|jgi:hypothetical protein|uniref:hypothetical protein n=1 Tax=Methylocystis echinoides TaxID=29468 RepID=UPI003437C6E0